MATGIFSVTLEDLKSQADEFGLEGKIEESFLKKNGGKYKMLYWRRNVSKWK